MNFDNIKVYTDLKKTQLITVNLRELLAELIYQRGTGIQAHALAFKIYNGDTNYSNQEKELLLQYVNKFCSPMIIDAITELCKQ